MKRTAHIFDSCRLLLLCCILVAAGGCGGSGSYQENLNDGLEKIKDGDYKGAVSKLETAVKLNPDSATAYCNLGVAYWHLGMLEQAINALRLSTELDNSDARVYEFLGQACMDAGKWDDARSAFDTAFRHSAPSARLLTSMAIVEMNAAKAEIACTFLEQALRLEPNYPPAVYNMALLQRDGFNNRDEAALHFQRYIALVPNDARSDEARRYLAILKSEQATGRFKPKTAVEQAAEDNKTAPAEDENLSRKEAETFSMYVEAKKTIGTSAGRRSSLADPLITSARSAADRGIYDEAIVLLNQAMKKDAANADALWSLAVLYEKYLKYSDSAELMYQRFDQQFPDDPRSRNEWQRQKSGKAPPPRTAAYQAFMDGVKLHSLQNWDGAIASYQKALQTDAKFVDAAYNLGLAYKSKGDLKNSRDAFLQALAIKPEMLKANYMAGVVHEELKEPAKALEYLNKTVSLDPGYALAHLLLGRIYSEMRDQAKAREHYERYLQLAPDGEFAKEATGWVNANKR